MPEFVAALDAEVMAWRGRHSRYEAGRCSEMDDTDATTKSYAEGDVLASIENVTGSRGADKIMGDEDDSQCHQGRWRQ